MMSLMRTIMRPIFGNIAVTLGNGLLDCCGAL